MLSNSSTISISWNTKQSLKEKKLEFEQRLKKNLSWDAFFKIAKVELRENNKKRGK